MRDALGLVKKNAQQMVAATIRTVFARQQHRRNVYSRQKARMQTPRACSAHSAPAGAGSWESFSRSRPEAAAGVAPAADVRPPPSHLQLHHQIARSGLHRR
jgi:hypothetical protein